MMNIAKTVVKNVIGKTNEYYLKEMKWESHSIRYEKAI